MRRLPWLLLLAACGDKDPPADDSTPVVDDSGVEESQPPEPVDADEDGVSDDEDCDDSDASIFPGAAESCDEIDQDCDGAIDEGFDADQDGAFSLESCPHGTDCDDSTAEIGPEAEEIPYDGVDQDCDGEEIYDADGDGFNGYNEDGNLGNDCDDTDASVSPVGVEIEFDGIDQDCSGADDVDGDNDGADHADYGGDDCDDEDPTVYPGARDWLNDSIDGDCDGADGATTKLQDAEISIEAQTTALLGYTVAVCDFDSDGLDDVIFGAPFGSSYNGSVPVFLGKSYSTWASGMSPSDADTLIQGGTRNFFGMQVICDDFDGDGYDDLSIQQGEIKWSSGGYDNDFKIYVYYGTGATPKAKLGTGDADAIFTFEMGAPDAGTVFSAANTSGDLDGDGAAEILIAFGNSSVSRYDGEDRALVLPGGTYSGNLDLEDELSHVFVPAQPYQLASMEALSDLDGDGSSDIFIGSTAWSSNWAEVLDTQDTGDPAADVMGRADFVAALPSASSSDLDLDDYIYASHEGQSTDQNYGWHVAEGDFDCDGVDDLAISTAGDSADEGGNTGGLFVFSAGAADLTGTDLNPEALADAYGYGDVRSGFLGYQLRGVGDADGDGCDDLLLSEPTTTYVDDEGNDADPDREGRVYLVSGALLGTGQVANWKKASLLMWTSNEYAATTGNSVAAGDITGNGELDFVIAEYDYNSSAGRVLIYLAP